MRIRNHALSCNSQSESVRVKSSVLKEKYIFNKLHSDITHQLENGLLGKKPINLTSDPLNLVRIQAKLLIRRSQNMTSQIR